MPQIFHSSTEWMRFVYRDTNRVGLCNVIDSDVLPKDVSYCANLYNDLSFKSGTLHQNLLIVIDENIIK
jgi:hypothetical protein